MDPLIDVALKRFAALLSRLLSAGADLEAVDDEVSFLYQDSAQLHDYCSCREITHLQLACFAKLPKDPSD